MRMSDDAPSIQVSYTDWSHWYNCGQGGLLFRVSYKHGQVFVPHGHCISELSTDERPMGWGEPGSSIPQPVSTRGLGLEKPGPHPLGKCFGALP